MNISEKEKSPGVFECEEWWKVWDDGARNVKSGMGDTLTLPVIPAKAGIA